MPQDGDADELLRHDLRLLHQKGAVRAEVVEHGHGRGTPGGGLGLARHQERVQQRLRVVPPHPDEQLVDEVAHRHAGGVDACDDLRDDGEPGVDVHVAEALLQRELHFRQRAVVEPQREKPEDVLERAAAALVGCGAAERDGAEEAADGGRHVAHRCRAARPRVVGHRRRVEQRPVVPRLRPLAVRLRRHPHRRQNIRHRGVVQRPRERPAPLPELEQRPRHQLRRRHLRYRPLHPGLPRGRSEVPQLLHEHREPLERLLPLVGVPHVL
mmetsp:Transcript_12159/g.42144  ORF Transcript_12159/g.42144 Transcript_12159/m.42144 type:complete len:269 (+) Transcript_12159:1360-2166(+)